MFLCGKISIQRIGKEQEFASGNVDKYYGYILYINDREWRWFNLVIVKSLFALALDTNKLTSARQHHSHIIGWYFPYIIPSFAAAS